MPNSDRPSAPVAGETTVESAEAFVNRHERQFFNPVWVQDQKQRDAQIREAALREAAAVCQRLYDATEPDERDNAKRGCMWCRDRILALIDSDSAKGG